MHSVNYAINTVTQQTMHTIKVPIYKYLVVHDVIRVTIYIITSFWIKTSMHQ